MDFLGSKIVTIGLAYGLLTFVGTIHNSLKELIIARVFDETPPPNTDQEWKSSFWVQRRFNARDVISIQKALEFFVLIESVSDKIWFS